MQCAASKFPIGHCKKGLDLAFLCVCSKEKVIKLPQIQVLRNHFCPLLLLILHHRQEGGGKTPARAHTLIYSSSLLHAANKKKYPTVKPWNAQKTKVSKPNASLRNVFQKPLLSTTLTHFFITGLAVFTCRSNRALHVTGFGRVYGWSIAAVDVNLPITRCAMMKCWIQLLQEKQREDVNLRCVAATCGPGKAQ